MEMLTKIVRETDEDTGEVSSPTLVLRTDRGHLDLSLMCVAPVVVVVLISPFLLARAVIFDPLGALGGLLGFAALGYLFAYRAWHREGREVVIDPRAGEIEETTWRALRPKRRRGVAFDSFETLYIQESEGEVRAYDYTPPEGERMPREKKAKRLLRTLDLIGEGENVKLGTFVAASPPEHEVVRLVRETIDPKVKRITIEGKVKLTQPLRVRASESEDERVRR